MEKPFNLFILQHSRFLTILSNMTSILSSHINSLSLSPGVCNFNGKVYCIGGLNGQTGTKHCYAYDIQADKWERIASLHTGM